MKIFILNILILIIYIILNDLLLINAKSSLLSSFQQESLGIKKYSMKNESLIEESDILKQIYYYARNYFYKRHQISENEWIQLKDDLFACTSDTSQRYNYDIYNEADRNWYFQNSINNALKRLNDNYTRYLSTSEMQKKYSSIQGTKLSSGIEIKRVWRGFHWKKLKYRLKSFLFPRVVSYVNQSKESNGKFSFLRKLCFWKRQLRHESDDFNVQFEYDKDSKVIDSQRQLITRYRSNQLKRFMFQIITPWLASKIHLNIPHALYIKIALMTSTIAVSLLASLRLIVPIIYPLEVVKILDNENDFDLHVGDSVVSIDSTIVDCLSSQRVNDILNSGNQLDIFRLGVERLEQVDERESESLNWTFHTIKGIKLKVINQNVITHPQAQRTQSETSNNLNADVGYIRIQEFTDETLAEVVSAIESLSVHTSAIVFDLRSCPGGTLGTALDVGSLFLPRGTTLTQLTFNGQSKKCVSLNRYANKQMHLLVLANQFTASSSEILIVALQENKRALVCGCNTVGKNRAQAIVMLPDGSGLIFSIREYLSPKGFTMAKGVTPDIYLKSPTDDIIQNIQWNATSKDWIINGHTYSSITK